MIHENLPYNPDPHTFTVKAKKIHTYRKFAEQLDKIGYHYAKYHLFVNQTLVQCKCMYIHAKWSKNTPKYAFMNFDHPICFNLDLKREYNMAIDLAIKLLKQ